MAAVILVAGAVAWFLVWNSKNVREAKVWREKDERDWSLLSSKTYSERSVNEEMRFEQLKAKKEVRRLSGLDS